MKTMLILLALALGGCAAHYTPPELPLSDPANPAAESGPAPEPSRTLALPEPDESAPARDSTPASPHEHHHSGDAPSQPEAGQIQGAHP